jgi:hypothetical protein
MEGGLWVASAMTKHIKYKSISIKRRRVCKKKAVYSAANTLLQRLPDWLGDHSRHLEYLLELDQHCKR